VIEGIPLLYMITYCPCPVEQFVSITAIPAYTHSKDTVTVMYAASLAS